MVRFIKSCLLEKLLFVNIFANRSNCAFACFEVKNVDWQLDVSLLKLVGASSGVRRAASLRYKLTPFLSKKLTEKESCFLT